MLEQLEFASPRLPASRSIWIQNSSTSDAALGLIFLDAELYMQRVHAPEIVTDLQKQLLLPPVTAVYVSSVDAASRHRDLICQSAFSECLAKDVMPWLPSVIGPHSHWLICGLSLSGLCAADTALRYPRLFAGALCQSPSAWWNDAWLPQHVQSNNTEAGRYWISVGSEETQEDVTHPPTGLHQRVSQRAACLRLSDRLRHAGADVQYSEYAGGHDPACWAAELPAALQWLVSGIPHANSN